MNFATKLLAAACVVVPAGAMAQGFEGAQLTAGILAYSDDRNFGETSYSGGLQFGIMSGISVGADFTHNGFRGWSGSSNSFTLHGIYDLGQASAGLFVTRDNRDAGETDVYGLEGATSLSGIDVSAYFGRFDGVIGDGTMIGVDGRFALTNQIGITANAGFLNGDESYSRISFGGDYQFGNGPHVFAELGRADIAGTADNFISVGGRIELGQGTTFGPRGITDLLPGF